MPFFFITATDEQGERVSFNWEAADADDAYRETKSLGYTDVVVESDIKVVEWIPRYFVSATDESGSRELTSVYAESAKEAYEFFIDNGYRDIVIHSSDASAVYNGQMVDIGSMIDRMLPDDLLEKHYQSVWQFSWRLSGRLYWKFRWILPLIVAVALFFQWNRGLLGSIGGTTILMVILLLPAFAAFLGGMFSADRRYKQLIDAFFWGRWQEVIQQASKLEGFFPEYALQSKAALALAAMGRHEAAQELLKPFAESSRVPRWLYLMGLSDLSYYAHDLEKQVDFIHQSAAAAPDLLSVQIDYARVLAIYRSEFEQAKQLLDQANQLCLDEDSQLILLRCRGILELEQGNFQAAKNIFLQCQQSGKELLEGLPSMFHLNQPWIFYELDLNQAYLAIALAELGEKEEAAELFQQVLPRFVALGYQALIDRYAAANA